MVTLVHGCQYYMEFHCGSRRYTHVLNGDSPMKRPGAISKDCVHQPWFSLEGYVVSEVLFPSFESMYMKQYSTYIYYTLLLLTVVIILISELRTQSQKMVTTSLPIRTDSTRSIEWLIESMSHISGNNCVPDMQGKHLHIPATIERRGDLRPNPDTCCTCMNYSNEVLVKNKYLNENNVSLYCGRKTTE